MSVVQIHSGAQGESVNNGKYHTESYKRKQQEKVDRIFGPILDHIKICEVCNGKYIWKGRKKTKPFERTRFCSRSCANTIGPKYRKYDYNYRTVCFKHHEKKCIICSEDLIVEVHHYDGNDKNDHPCNLVPLCSTHHKYIHSGHKYIVKECVDEYVEKFIKKFGGVAQFGGAQALQA